MNVTRRKLLILLKNSIACCCLSHKLLICPIEDNCCKGWCIHPLVCGINQKSYLKLWLFSITTNNANWEIQTEYNLLLLFRKHCSGILAHRNVESCFCQKLKFWPPGFQKQLKWSSQNLFSKHFHDYCWHFNQNMILLFLFIVRFWFSNIGQWGKRKAIFLLKTIFHPFSMPEKLKCPSKHLHFPIIML